MTAPDSSTAKAAAAPRTRAPRREPRAGLRARVATAAVACAAALAVLQFHRPPEALRPKPFAALFGAVAAPDAFGASGEVRVRFAMPGETVRFPLAVHGDPAALVYRWVSVAPAAAGDSARPLSAGALVAPREPGFYHLAVERGGERQIVPDVSLAVLTPFEAKANGLLDGYRIGTYLAERVARGGRPEGFIKVTQETAALPLSKHFRVGDFLSRDGQRQWPRYAAVDPRLIDKLELVIAEVARAKGNPDSVRVRVNVNAAFRSPSYNSKVARAAKDSRHQQGDAADVAIDADFDGVLTRNDSRLVAAAVERVERAHPHLVGGLGLYLSKRYAHSYVHIDARGRRARWNG